MDSRPLEKDVQATIMEITQLLGWECYHTHDSRRSAAGFPDLVLARDRVVFAELKREGEKPRPDQVRWLDALVSADCEVYLWTIADLAEVTAVLQSRWRLSGLASSWPKAADRLGLGNVSGRVPRTRAAS